MELAKELLQRGAKPGGRNALGATVLSEAIATNDRELIDLLLKAGADPNLGNPDDETPLMLAARAGSLPIVEALVKAGAKVDTREKFRGQSALMWAVGSNTAGRSRGDGFPDQAGRRSGFPLGSQRLGQPDDRRAAGAVPPEWRPDPAALHHAFGLSSNARVCC